MAGQRVMNVQKGHFIIRSAVGRLLCKNGKMVVK